MEKRLLADVPGSWAPVWDITDESLDFMTSNGYVVLDAVLRFDWGQNVAYYRRPDMAPRLHNHFAVVEKGPDLPGREPMPALSEKPEIEDEPEWEVGDRVRVIFWGEPGTDESRQYEGKEGVITHIHGYVHVDIGDGLGALPCTASELEPVAPEVEDEKVTYTFEDFSKGDRVVVDNFPSADPDRFVGKFGTVVETESPLVIVEFDIATGIVGVNNTLPCMASEIRPLTPQDFKAGDVVKGVAWNGSKNIIDKIVGQYGTVVIDDLEGKDDEYVEVVFAGISYSMPMAMDEVIIQAPFTVNVKE